jgi:hypothetical protein
MGYEVQANSIPLVVLLLNRSIEKIPRSFLEAITPVDCHGVLFWR